MPEGPEIRRAADEIENVLRNQKIDDIFFGLDRLKRHKNVFLGRKVKRIETRGKAMITHITGGWSIYSHNQLYGVWQVVERGVVPDTQRQLRLAIHTKSHSALLFSASDISVWKTKDIEQHAFLQRIGPDILSPELTAGIIVKRLKEKSFSNKKLSVLYLDQAFLAGIGNYLRSEILFAAGLHPNLKPSDLTRAQLNKLASKTRQITLRSYKHAGVTLTQKDYRLLRKAGDSYEKSRFMVFGREGKQCRVCGTKVKKVDASSRRLYFCEQCQPG